MNYIKKMLEKLKQEPILFMLRKMWRHSENQKPRMILMWSLLVFARLIWLLPPLALGLFLNELQKNGVTDGNIWLVMGLLGLVLATNVSGWFPHIPGRVIERSVAYKIDRFYKKYLYNAVLTLPLTWHNDHDSGDTIDKVNKATDSLHEYSRSTFQIISVLVRIVSGVFVLWYFSFNILLVGTVLIILAIYVLFRFDKVLVPQYKELNKYDNKAQAKVYDSLSNVTTVKVLHIEKPVLEGVQNTWWLSYKDYMRNKVLIEYKWFSGGVIFDLFSVLPVAMYIFYNYKNGLPIMIGTVAAMHSYLRDFMEVYFNLAGTYEDIMVQKARIQGVEEIENQYEALGKRKRKVYSEIGSYEFANILFKYDTNLKSNILNIDNLKIKSGEKVALIGESGSGKSTLLKVLHGMYDKAEGEIFVDGKTRKTNFADIDLNSTLVPQEPEVFSASIRENITLLMNFPEEEIKNAVELAQFTDVVEGLPKGYESVVNEKGVNLSGGQKQRLALARALLFSKEKEIIYLDESTSSVDPINEVKIYQNIFKEFKGVTVLATIHKMNLLKYFDRILILEGGKIKRDGTFDELLETDSGFRNSWEEFIKENNIE